MELSLQRELRQVMGQQMYQALSLLQMSTEELEDYLHALSMENPLLEEQPARRPVESRLISMRTGRVRRHNGEMQELPIPDRCGKTLTESLHEQLLTMELPPDLETALRHLIINLDDRGYLSPEIRESGTWKKNPGLFAEALTLLQSMEPPGVGASDLRECLCLQLRRSGEADSLAFRICEGCLEHLARNHINHIARRFSVPESEVAAAKERIRELNPFPANGFDDGSGSVAVVPDLILRIEEGEPVLYVGDEFLPTYRISPFYAEMAERPDLSEEERRYFREKTEQAKWAISCVRRRRETLLHCAEEIVDLQWEFFSEWDGALHPLSMGELAARLGVHLSTVSRTVRNKYISCSRGTFPLSSFFAAEVSGDTADEITRTIRYIVSKEDRNHPLSDSRICEELKACGYDIARRTVAKYREKENIPSATGRKARS